MNLKRYIKVICCFLIFSLFISSTVFAVSAYDIPDSITVTVGKDKIGSVQYGNYTLSAKKISVNNRDEVVYCLEIDKGYPSGNVFKLQGAPEDAIDKIIASGYPNKSAEELNVSNDNDAYFATQIAIWSYLEKYDINKLQGSNDRILNAIKQIYNEGIKAKNIELSTNKEYMSENKSIQRVVVLFEKTEEEIEQLQPEYPPQEG